MLHCVLKESKDLFYRGAGCCYRVLNLLPEERRQLCLSNEEDAAGQMQPPVVGDPSGWFLAADVSLQPHYSSAEVLRTLAWR